MTRRLATVHWVSPPPTSVDEELVAYDDGTAWLVIRGPRDAASVIGTWCDTIDPADQAELVTIGDRTIDLLRPGDGSSAPDRIAAAVKTKPLATAQFLAALTGAGQVTLALLGGGTRPVHVELDPDAITVHLESAGVTTRWFPAAPPTTGFITPDASGLGGLHRRAVVPAGAFGAMVLEVPGGIDSDEIAVQLSGWLTESLPDDATPASFRVRTVPGQRPS